jgi:hypothetical protein
MAQQQSKLWEKVDCIKLVYQLEKQRQAQQKPKEKDREFFPV